MKQRNEDVRRGFAVVLLLALFAAPQFGLLRRASGQSRTINVNEDRIDLRALGINNEVLQIGSLVGAQARFFKRASELRQKGIVSPRDVSEFKNEGDKRKADLLTIKRELESLISKLKQGNHWDEAFDAQVLASLNGNDTRSVVAQAGGARKLFETAIGESSVVRQEIDDEVRQVDSKQTGALRHRSDRALAAHASPPVGKLGCAVLLAGYVAALVARQNTIACTIAARFQEKGCGNLACP